MILTRCLSPGTAIWRHIFVWRLNVFIQIAFVSFDVKFISRLFSVVASEGREGRGNQIEWFQLHVLFIRNWVNYPFTANYRNWNLRYFLTIRHPKIRASVSYRPESCDKKCVNVKDTWCRITHLSAIETSGIMIHPVSPRLISGLGFASPDITCLNWINHDTRRLNSG